MKTKGFSLIELLIVISIIITIFALGIASFNRFNRRERLRQAAQTLKSTFRFVQTKAISAEKPVTGCSTYTGMRMSFTESSYSYQHVCDPEGLVGSATTVTLPFGITLVPIPSPITFLQTQSTDIATQATITFSNSAETYVLTVLANGTVSESGF